MSQLLASLIKYYKNNKFVVVVFVVSIVKLPSFFFSVASCVSLEII